MVSRLADECELKEKRSDEEKRSVFSVWRDEGTINLGSDFTTK
jgi:hypothetical protein